MVGDLGAEDRPGEARPTAARIKFFSGTEKWLAADSIDEDAGAIFLIESRGKGGLGVSFAMNCLYALGKIDITEEGNICLC